MIRVGDRIPEVALLRRTADAAVESVAPSAVFAGKRVLLFGVPGAFTPTCSDDHLPGYVMHAAALKDKGIDSLVCVAVNDPHVLHAWSQSRHAQAILMLSDGNGDFTRAMDLEADFSRYGMGSRTRRYAAVVQDGVIEQLQVEPDTGVSVSSAESMFDRL